MVRWRRSRVWWRSSGLPVMTRVDDWLVSALHEDRDVSNLLLSIIHRFAALLKFFFFNFFLRSPTNSRNFEI